MDMTLTHCWDCGNDLWATAIAAFVIFLLPIGAWVMRRVREGAVGGWRAGLDVLHGLGLAMTPVAVLLLAGTLLLWFG